MMLAIGGQCLIEHERQHGPRLARIGKRRRPAGHFRQLRRQLAVQHAGRLAGRRAAALDLFEEPIESGQESRIGAAGGEV